MNPSKAHDYLPHDLFLVKLEAYDFNKDSAKLLLSYLTNLTQRIKIVSTFSE